MVTCTRKASHASPRQAASSPPADLRPSITTCLQCVENCACSLAAQLARTEEAAKRILTRTDASARGGVAQRLLDAERDLAAAQAELAELRSQWARWVGQAAGGCWGTGASGAGKAYTPVNCQ